MLVGAQAGTPPDVFHIGVQYYVAARAAVRHRHGGVAGNLFHHAFEMMLRAILVRESVFTAPQLRKMFGNRHDVPGMWAATKEAMPTLDGTRFDPFIDQLHKWTRIRFGEVHGGRRKTLLVTYARDIRSPRGVVDWKGLLPVDIFRNSDAQADEPEADVYRVSLEDADELFVTLVSKMGWDEPKFVREELLGLAASDTYEWWNRHVIGDASYPRSFE